MCLSLSRKKFVLAADLTFSFRSTTRRRPPVSDFEENGIRRRHLAAQFKWLLFRQIKTVG